MDRHLQDVWNTYVRGDPHVFLRPQHVIVEAPEPLLVVREFGSLLKPDPQRWVRFCKMFARNAGRSPLQSWHEALAALYEAPEWLMRSLYSNALLHPETWMAANLNQMMVLERAIHGPSLRISCSAGVIVAHGQAFMLPEHVAELLSRPYLLRIRHYLAGAAASAAYEALERDERELHLRLLAAHFAGCDREVPEESSVGLTRKQALALARSWETDASPYRYLQRELLPRVMLPSDFEHLLAGRDFRSRRTREFVNYLLDRLDRAADSDYPLIIQELRSLR